MTYICLYHVSMTFSPLNVLGLNYYKSHETAALLISPIAVTKHLLRKKKGFAHQGKDGHGGGGMACMVLSRGAAEA